MPRAVLRNNKPVLLDGEWWFALDAGNAGLNENWFLVPPGLLKSDGENNFSIDILD